MTRRLLSSWVTWAIVGVLIGALLYLALSTPRSAIVIPSGGTASIAESDRWLSGAPKALRYAEDSGQLGPIPLAAERTSAPTPSPTYGLGTVRHSSGLTQFARRPAATPSPSPVPVDVRDQSGAGDFDPPSEPPGPASTSLDLADWALPTPALRPLASDCRLPCYGTARVGPASWYRDWRYGPTALYAALPGYTGGVVAVVVCTFLEGRANCLTVPVVDVCGCLRHTASERLVDLSPSAFAQFAPLSAGIVMVQVVVLR